MTIVNVSLDTTSRQLVLTINGVLVSYSEVIIEKYVYDGEESIRFSYIIETTNSDGMKERRQFYLPSQPELASMANGSLNNDGFASKTLRNDEKAKADVIDFLRKKP